MLSWNVTGINSVAGESYIVAITINALHICFASLLTNKYTAGYFLNRSKVREIDKNGLKSKENK